MGQAQINVRTRACSRTFIARTKQAALTHHVRGKELMYLACNAVRCCGPRKPLYNLGHRMLDLQGTLLITPFTFIA